MSNLATQPARASGEFAIGGDLPIVRLGYGAMQIPGPGVWGEPRDHDEVIRVLRRALELELFQLHRIDPAFPLADQLGALIELTPDQVQRLDAAEAHHE